MKNLVSGLATALVLAGVLVATPAQAWPEGASGLLVDLNLFDIECINMTRSGKTVWLHWGEAGAAVKLDVQANGPARPAFSFELRNVLFGGLYPVRHAIVDCVCDRYGFPRWEVPGFGLGWGSCSCTAAYNFGGGLTVTEPLSFIEIGGGNKCSDVYGPLSSPGAPKLQDRLKLGKPSR